MPLNNGRRRSLMVGKIASGFVLAAVVLVGLLGQVGEYLLDMAPADQPADATLAAGEAPYGARGSHAVGVRRLRVDESPIPITLWYPALKDDTRKAPLAYAYAINMLGPDSAIALATFDGQADPGALPDLSADPYPLVILSHGFAIGSSSYAWLAEHLASHGFVVVSPDHDESLDPGVLWKSTIERPQDILVTLDYLDEQVGVGGEFEGLIDTELVAVLGHSYGGYTALAAAGARLNTAAFQVICETGYATDDPVGFLCDALLPHMRDMARLAGLNSVPPSLWPAWADPRVDAVVSMAGDAAVFGRIGLAEISVPVMAIGGTADTDSPFVWGTQLTYESASSTRKAELALSEAAHLIFAGRCEEVRRILKLVSVGFCTDPAWDRDRAHQIVSHYVTAFLLAELKHDLEAVAALAPDQASSGATYRAEGY